MINLLKSWFKSKPPTVIYVPLFIESDAMIDWLSDNKINWMWKSGSEMQFKNDIDAVAFRLKFGL
jgi:hypothetical protein